MTMEAEVKKLPTWFRVLQLVTGGIAIALAGFVLVHPIVTTLFLLVFLGIALIALGVSNIVDGISIKRMSKTSRAIEAIIGVAAIIGGFFALTHPIVALVSLIWLVTLFVFISGAGLVATGISRANKSKGIRITGIILGSIVLVCSGVLLAFPGLALPVMIMLLSISLFMNGMDRIISAAIGKIIVIREQYPSGSTFTKANPDKTQTGGEISKGSKAVGGK